MNRNWRSISQLSAALAETGTRTLRHERRRWPSGRAGGVRAAGLAGVSPVPSGDAPRVSGGGGVRLYFAYTGVVPETCCEVSFCDSEGITHSVDVVASSLFEAAAMALARFRRAGLSESAFCPATRLKIAARPPANARAVTLARVQARLDSNGKSPSEQALKARLRDLGRCSVPSCAVRQLGVWTRERRGVERRLDFRLGHMDRATRPAGHEYWLGHVPAHQNSGEYRDRQKTVDRSTHTSE